MKDGDMEDVAQRRQRVPAREGWIWRVIFEPSVVWGTIGLLWGAAVLLSLWRLGAQVGRLADIMEVR